MIVPFFLCVLGIVLVLIGAHYHNVEAVHNTCLTLGAVSIMIGLLKSGS